jgi:hypothetical protein
MSEAKRLSCIKEITEIHQKKQNKKSLKMTLDLLNDLKKCNEFIVKQEIKIQKNIQRRIDIINSNINKVLNQKYKNKLEHKKLKGFKKIKQYLLAELYTIVQGQINKKQYIQRKNACLDCHGRVNSIEGKIDPGGIGFCSLCGCGASKRAALSVKLTIGGASCPLNKWEALKGTEWSIKIAGAAFLGIFNSIIYHLNKKINFFIGNLTTRRTI